MHILSIHAIDLWCQMHVQTVMRYIWNIKSPGTLRKNGTTLESHVFVCDTSLAEDQGIFQVNSSSSWIFTELLHLSTHSSTIINQSEAIPPQYKLVTKTIDQKSHKPV